MGDVKNDRGGEAIYNQEDVLNILDEYGSMSKDLVRSELELVANMGAVYCSDLLAQGQQQGLQLCGDIGAVEEETKLEAVASLMDWAGEDEVSLPVRKTMLASLSSNAGGGSGGADAEALRDECRTLGERNQLLQRQTAELLRERSSLASELADLKSQFNSVKAELSNEGKNSAAVQEMEAQLTGTRQMLDSKNAEVERIKEDLNKRLIDSNQFRDMKAILAKKNQQIKELRDKIRQYEPDEDGLIRED